MDKRALLDIGNIAIVTCIIWALPKWRQTLEVNNGYISVLTYYVIYFNHCQQSGGHTHGEVDLLCHHKFEVNNIGLFVLK